MKHVLIIYTGGTIGMTRTDNGYAPRSVTSAPRLTQFPTFIRPKCPRGTLWSSRLCWTPPI